MDAEKTFPLRVVSHWRSGTHLLMQTLHLNFPTGVPHYCKLQGSHARLGPDPHLIVHIERDLLGVMLSMFRLRDRYGIDKSVTFSKFISTPYAALPRCKRCDVMYNGQHESKPTPRREASTPPTVWLARIRLFRQAHQQVQYADLVADPEAVVERLAVATATPRRTPFVPVVDKVGFVPIGHEEVIVTPADQALLAPFQARADREKDDPILYPRRKK